jgi:hypothetical protein
MLCPTCHTKADKIPEAHPTALLLEKKAERVAAVERVGGTPLFTTREEARLAVEVILNRNALIFKTSGPSAADGSLASTEEAGKWSRLVLSEIVPGNELITAIVEMNPNLATMADRSAAELLRLHTQDLREKHESGVVDSPALRFPEVAEEIFAGGSLCRNLLSRRRGLLPAWKNTQR